jgi:hypothetical protein
VGFFKKNILKWKNVYLILFPFGEMRSAAQRGGVGYREGESGEFASGEVCMSDAIPEK